MAGVPKKIETLNRLYSDEKFIEAVKNDSDFFNLDKYSKNLTIIQNFLGGSWEDMYEDQMESLINDIIRDMYRFTIEFEYIYFESSKASRMLMLPGRVKLFQEDGTLPQFIYNRMMMIAEHLNIDKLKPYVNKQHIIDSIEINIAEFSERCMNDYNITMMVKNEIEYKEAGYL